MQRAARTVCFAGLLNLTSALAQTAAVSQEQAAETEAGYQDRLIEGGELAPLAQEGSDAPYDAKGWPRAWRAEAFTSHFEREGERTREDGLVFSGQLDTPHYGAFTLDAIARIDPSDALFTLWQRDMPFDGGWRASSSLGMQNTRAIDLNREQYRFALPTQPLAGASTEWWRKDNLQLQLSAGEPGTFTGSRVAGFRRSGGNVLSAGAQWNLTPQWQGGVQIGSANEARTQTDPSAPDTRTSGHSLFVANAWRGANARVQANLLVSKTDSERHQSGAWIDAEVKRLAYRHNFGVFRLERNLRWTSVPMSSDLQGAYYRVHRQSQRWLWDLGVDRVEPVSGGGEKGVLGSGSVRYQISRSLGVGSGGVVRHAKRKEWSGFVFADRLDNWGSTRVQVDFAGKEDAQRGTQLTIDRNWNLPVGARLGTSINASRENGASGRTQRIGAAVLAGVDVLDNLSLDANVRWSQNRAAVRSSDIYADVGLNWRITPRWSLSASYYDNQSEDPGFVTIDPLIPVTPTLPVLRNRALFLILRYEDRAGTPNVPLGGALGTGAGNIVGHLFLDANNNGRREANEAAAESVVVVLDGRFPTRTDASGRFEFSYVAAGKHTLWVEPDNLPLPWSVENDGKREVNVRTRETTLLEVAAIELK